MLPEAGRRNPPRNGRISDIFANGLHECLTEFLDDMHELSRSIQASFFASTTVD